eukprot:302782-Rhodomonas_salina.2
MAGPHSTLYPLPSLSGSPSRHGSLLALRVCAHALFSLSLSRSWLLLPRLLTPIPLPPGCLTGSDHWRGPQGSSACVQASVDLHVHLTWARNLVDTDSVTRRGSALPILTEHCPVCMCVWQHLDLLRQLRARGIVVHPWP